MRHMILLPDISQITVRKRWRLEWDALSFPIRVSIFDEHINERCNWEDTNRENMEPNHIGNDRTFICHNQTLLSFTESILLGISDNFLIFFQSDTAQHLAPSNIYECLRSTETIVRTNSAYIVAFDVLRSKDNNIYLDIPLICPWIAVFMPFIC